MLSFIWRSNLLKFGSSCCSLSTLTTLVCLVGFDCFTGSNSSFLPFFSTDWEFWVLFLVFEFSWSLAEVMGPFLKKSFASTGFNVLTNLVCLVGFGCFTGSNSSLLESESCRLRAFFSTAPSFLGFRFFSFTFSTLSVLCWISPSTISSSEESDMRGFGRFLIGAFLEPGCSFDFALKKFLISIFK